jgi:translation initiation factor IF-2
MGHVDHGKTSLLDVIRDAHVQQSEAGGITQHIGAYTVDINGKPITFLDTPGHEAFTAMRMRGAQVTDIAVLVVAANDGVMPQTVEAINHAKAAGVDIIVAINKVDLPSANPDRVKQELTEYGLLVEDWGGETIAVPVSALQKTGIEQLLEMIIIVSEMKELRANPNNPARGSIIEAKLDKGRGPVATVLVQDGTLNIGDPVVAGVCFGKVRAMADDGGNSVKSAGPSIPVEIIGLSDVPSAGDAFYVADREKQARQLSETVIAKGRESMIKAASKVSLDDLFNQIQSGSVQDLNIVLKADVQGSVEALRTSLDKLTNDQVRVRIIHGGVGAISESDVMLASASNAIIIGFNVRPDAMAKSVADAEKVDMRLYRVIYSAIDDITAAMKGMLAPEFREKVLGHAEIRQIFKASGVGTIGGSYVIDGQITRNAKVRIVRDGRVVYDGTLETLRRFKDDVREVASGYECGMLFHRYNDIRENDRVEAYVMEEIPR